MISQKFLEGLALIKFFIITSFQIGNAFVEASTNILAGEELIANFEFVDADIITLIRPNRPEQATWVGGKNGVKLLGSLGFLGDS